FEDVFNVAMPTPTASPQVGFALFSNEEPTSADAKPTAPVPPDTAPAPQAASEPTAPVAVVSDTQPPAPALEELPSVTPEAVAPIDAAKEPRQPESTPAEVLFAAVRIAIQQLLSAPMKTLRWLQLWTFPTRRPRRGCSAWSTKAYWKSRRGLRATSSS